MYYPVLQEEAWAPLAGLPRLYPDAIDLLVSVLSTRQHGGPVIARRSCA